ncbi:hypothetical protein ACFX2C_000644 [Malus domestica]
MSDTKSIVKQVEELQVIVHELDEENLGLKEGFVVGSIIEKLPLNWKDFKIYLKHLTEDMSMDQLILKLRVEEDHRKNEKYDVLSLEAKANVVEGGDSHKARHHQKNKGDDVAKKALTTVIGKTFKKSKEVAGFVERQVIGQRIAATRMIRILRILIKQTLQKTCLYESNKND